MDGKLVPGFVCYIESDNTKPCEIRLHRLSLSKEDGEKLTRELEKRYPQGPYMYTQKTDGEMVRVLDLTLTYLHTTTLKALERKSTRVEFLSSEEANLRKMRSSLITDGLGDFTCEMPQTIAYDISKILSHTNTNETEELLPSVCDNPKQTVYYLERPIYDGLVFKGLEVHRVSMCACVSLSCTLTCEEEGYRLHKGTKEKVTELLAATAFDCATVSRTNDPVNYLAYMKLYRLFRSPEFNLDAHCEPLPQSLREKCKVAYDNPETLTRHFDKLLEDILDFANS
jgi:hypothetical protein